MLYSEEINNEVLQQYKILCHAYNLNKEFTNEYNYHNLYLIVDKLRNSKYYNIADSIVTITSLELNELFQSDNLKFRAILIILGRNKIIYKKYIHRPKINGRQITVYNQYKIFLNTHFTPILQNDSNKEKE